MANKEFLKSDLDSSGVQLSAPAHSLSIEEVLRQLCTRKEDGLTAGEADKRLQTYGPNKLDEGEGVSIAKILLLSFGIQSWIEGGVIAAVVGLNIVVGFVQEYAAEKTMESLHSLTSPTGTVSRDGQTKVVPTADIVPGDMVELKTGNTVPADLRLVEAVNFETDEMLLTGESLPVHKIAETTFKEDIGPGDRLNIAYSSSTVTKGRARGTVIATGMNTEVGQIAAALQASRSKRRPVKRTEQGTTKKRWYLQAWALTATDAIGRFLGVNVGTLLQRKLSKLAIILFGVAVVFAIVVMSANLWSNNREVILYAVATGLSMIPACLVVVLTITMAVGTKRMAQRHVIVRKLDSLEALGAVTNICSDKTGTLTQGKMVVKRAWIPSKGTYSISPSSEPFNPALGDIFFVDKAPIELSIEEAESGDPATYTDLLSNNECLEEFLNVASMANLAHVYLAESGQTEWHARGEPTEIAIQVFASRFDWNRDRWTTGPDALWHHKSEFPFDSDVKLMSVVFEKFAERGKNLSVFTKGAVERVLDACTTVIWENGTEPVSLTEAHRQFILQNMESLAQLGLRVLAFGSKFFAPETESFDDIEPSRSEVEKDLCFLGLVGIYDPPRPETKMSIETCHKAGISVHMVTGDHVGTAKAIAQQVGILPADLGCVAKDVADAMVMTASDFDRLTEDEIDALPTLPLVIARCAPRTKVRMINALHRRGHFVAMTGDGVNDSPSLKHADVGIAMGQNGSDVAKDASDIILTDDNFASILNAIEEGRRIFDNIQKFVLHLLSENIAQACTLLIGLAFKDQDSQSVFPLAPVEILWIIMITSGMPDMGLGMEVATANIMNRPPQSKQGIFTWEVIIDIGVYGLWMACLCLAAFSLVMWGFGDGNLGHGCNRSYSAECDLVFRARATTFVCLTWFALFLAWEMIDMRRSFFRMQPGSTRYFTQWIYDVWRNKFLFWAIIAGFGTIFPILYIPVINHDVFKHTGISWEWGVVFVEAFLFFLGAETWKWAKRIYFRRYGFRAKIQAGTRV
ncbi:hypothetical protein UA08_04996 [Talaromyces atroroseus]|uniref:P-type Na(+) transporter n=1 Tax=Talaromyces atroroseus TaxID=1441469 RepID=A0A225AVB4_TALAT|nr:hypothetical protein UA08_04996 [Talaromyces atroroseus]OKL59539.1 hypothetical protein UA08_04996 [Talaromyces atroroseus]